MRAGALMTLLGALETKGGRCFQGNHVRGITRWKRQEIKYKLTKESLQPIWQVQDLGKEDQCMCSETL